MYRLYVDEVGTDDLVHLDKDKHRYLSLTGVAMHVNHARDLLVPCMNEIKGKVFKYDPDEPLIFHRKDILGGKGPFGLLRSDEPARDLFNDMIIKMISNCPYVVITALIDKLWMIEQRHWRNTHPYHYLMEILVEKYAQFLERHYAIGDIMPEARKGTKDEKLQEAFNEVKRNGTRYVKADRIHSVIRGDKLKFRCKPDNVAGLQLCDLIAHPSHIYTRVQMGHECKLGDFSEKIVKILVGYKYDRSYSGNINGYGIKHLP